MLKPQVHQSHQSLKPLIALSKPFLPGNAHAFRALQSSPIKNIPKIRVGISPSVNIKAIASFTEKTTEVKATVTVKPSVGGLVSGVVDDVKDMFGKSLLLELVSAELDPKTGAEKPTIKGFAHRAGEDKDGHIKYESKFEVPPSFGEVGAILVENEHHKEMYLNDIVLDGLRNGPVNITCGSWVQSKHVKKHKRIFFTNKVNF